MDLILSSPILTLLVCHSFLILLYLRNSRIDVFVSDTHHFLASHSVSISLALKIFSLTVASNCQLFCLLWSLTKLSYANAKENYYADCFGCYKPFEFYLRNYYRNNSNSKKIAVFLLQLVLLKVKLSNSNNNNNSIKASLQISKCNNLFK